MSELIDALIEDERWQAAGLHGLAEGACRAALVHLGYAPAGFRVSVLGCDDTRIAGLNAEFRGKPAPTNVLSWPASDLMADSDGATPAAPAPGRAGEAADLGDIAISYDSCAREAAAQDTPFDAHVSHLMLHGCLHLLGFDHIRPKDAALMEGLEAEILAAQGIADPYG